LTRSYGGKHSLREVRSALSYNLRNGKTALTHLAAQLAMSRRSLQREIFVHGMTFRSLLDEARHERALALLQDRSLSMTEVAARLGYADATAFSRAFQRWTGRPPRRHRNSGA
jgi:AraC-like DNA-binding protein